MRITSEDIMTAVENFAMLSRKIFAGDESGIVNLADVFVKYVIDDNELGMEGVAHLISTTEDSVLHDLFSQLVADRLKRYPAETMEMALDKMTSFFQTDIEAGKRFFQES